ncbi:MAG: NAD(+) synthase [Succinivibrio sp.]
MANVKYYAAGRLNTTPLDFNGNFEKILTQTELAKKDNITLIAFPELSITGFDCGDLFAHYEIAKASVRTLLKLKYSLCEGITAGVGLPLLGNDNRIYDGYVFLRKGQILGISVLHSCYNSRDQRVRYFRTPCADDLSFTIGSETFVPDNNFVIDSHKVSVFFNEGDLSFIREPELIICPEAKRFELFEAQSRVVDAVSLSSAMNCEVLTTNLLGCESGSDIYDGLSVFASRGSLEAQSSFLSFKRADYVKSDCGISEFLNEYDTVVRAVSLGQFDWMLKTRAHGYALSMSGGADSGLCATCVCYGQLAALEELGYEQYKALLEPLKFDVPSLDDDHQKFIKEKMMPQILTTVYQGSAVSGSVTRTAASKVAHNIGASHHEWSIAKLVEDYVSIINETTPGDPLNWDRDDLTLQNIQARSRAPGIWMIANRYNKLLMSTCNASEDAVGYCTMDGDTAGGLSPIGDVSKSRILKINAHIAKDGIEVCAGGIKLDVPDMSYISAQAPTAELRPGQTDERDLMPYVILDRIHYLHQNDYASPQLILDTLAQEYGDFSRDELKTFVVRYFTKFAVNQWKRERGATTFHIEKNDLNAKNGFIFPLLNDGYRSLLEDLK